MGNYFDTGALLFGFVGSTLWAQNGRFVRYVSIFWMVSSMLWIAYALSAHLPAVGLNHVVNLGLNLYGCRKWLGNPQARRIEPPASAATHDAPGNVAVQ
ncbi:hypothetical protein [Noviherbaspirillum pedocola]|uniref:Uncharacterized protein n=1 Tax=Noviherbaspirillum pedocola TaxID=2801341 RepID=A0A934SV49_9BURK|nr:hypothetical protein [Noviherbaspirillum pedocola]MBK4735888.1 hypothetical protein [Noviherbaspirillum pedocola]